MHRLPWQEWDFLNKGLASEAVLFLSVFPISVTHTLSVANQSVTNHAIFRRVRITSIFGDSTNIQDLRKAPQQYGGLGGSKRLKCLIYRYDCVSFNINIAGDRQLIAKLQKRGAELINLEQPQRQDFIKLWDEPCDILFYSGHSESCFDGTVSSLQINSTDSLNLQEIRNTLSKAIRKGLKLEIFNYCDGLGLAKQLADLQLPYIIVWREPVTDKIAQTFLEYFLSSYAEGKSLFNSVQNARINSFCI